MRAPLLPHNAGSWNLVWQQIFQKHPTFFEAKFCECKAPKRRPGAKSTQYLASDWMKITDEPLEKGMANVVQK
jgi:hypothetical protein